MNAQREAGGRATARVRTLKVGPSQSPFLLLLGLAMLTLIMSVVFLFPQRALATGETVVVQIIGPAQPPGFSPALLTIHLYDTVVFSNQSSPAASYSVAADDGSFSSPVIPPGQQWQTTFSSLGAHAYHDTSSSQHIVGEILVVANSVNLLPTPMPQIESTVVAIIKGGKLPTDTIALSTVTPAPAHKFRQTGAGIFPFPIIFIAGSIVLVLFLLFMGIMLYRWRVKRINAEMTEEDELFGSIDEDEASTQRQKEGAAVSAPSTRQQGKMHMLLTTLRRRGSHNEADMDDE